MAVRSQVNFSGYNKKIFSIWKNNASWPTNITDKDIEMIRIPSQYPPMQNGGLLIVGLNPSYDPNIIKKIFPDRKLSKMRIKEIYSWLDFKSWDEFNIQIEDIKEEHENAKKYYSTYFELSKTLSENIGFEGKYNHIDLFNIRITNSKKLPLFICNKKRYNSGLNNFGLAQINLIPEAIEALDPHIILVENAEASRLFKTYLGRFLVSNEIDSTLGYHTYSIKDRKVPIFFSSMLSNGALDEHSRERLIWHMKKAVKENGRLA